MICGPCQHWVNWLPFPCVLCVEVSSYDIVSVKHCMRYSGVLVDYFISVKEAFFSRPQSSSMAWLLYCIVFLVKWARYSLKVITPLYLDLSKAGTKLEIDDDICNFSPYTISFQWKLIMRLIQTSELSWEHHVWHSLCFSCLTLMFVTYGGSLVLQQCDRCPFRTTLHFKTC